MDFSKALYSVIVSYFLEPFGANIWCYGHLVMSIVKNEQKLKKSYNHEQSRLKLILGNWGLWCVCVTIFCLCIMFDTILKLKNSNCVCSCDRCIHPMQCMSATTYPKVITDLLTTKLSFYPRLCTFFRLNQMR